jgi:carbamate kinase
VMLTDADAVYVDWGLPTQKAIRHASPDALKAMSFAAGSIGPKVDAACRFATSTGKTAAIGAIADLAPVIAGHAGTTFSASDFGLTYAPARGPLVDAARMRPPSKGWLAQ